MSDTKRWLSIKEVADALDVSHTTIWRWIKKGELPAVKVGKQYRIAPEQLDAYIRVNTTAPPIRDASGKP